jgi:hypothetical protein
MMHSEHYKKYTMSDKKYIKTQYNNQKLKCSQKFAGWGTVKVDSKSILIEWNLQLFWYAPIMLIFVISI